MTNEQFCAIHSAFTGEKITNVKQIVLESFSGEELKEYIEFHMKERDALPKQKCIVCKRERPELEMRNVDTLDGTSNGKWIYACDDINPHGLGGTCYGKYNRVLYVNGPHPK